MTLTDLYSLATIMYSKGDPAPCIKCSSPTILGLKVNTTQGESRAAKPGEVVDGQAKLVVVCSTCMIDFIDHFIPRAVAGTLP
jgi:hypothetical protein